MGGDWWWPHDDDPYYLLDSPEDGVIEDRCWVPVRAIEGDGYAAARARGGVLAAALEFIGSASGVSVSDLFPDEYVLAWAGERAWQRPAARPSGEGDWTWVDEKGRRVEYCPWAPCEPGDEGAVEFYVLEVVEREDGET